MQSAFSLIAAVPFWLDEILELRVIANDHLRDLLVRVSHNAGGVPIDYLVRAASVRLFGMSRLGARLPSLISSVVSAVGVYFLAGCMRLRYPLIAAAIFCTLPLQFRYALEARSYELALAIGIWATMIFMSLVRAPRIRTTAVWGMLALLGIYTQPFVIFTFFACLAWLVLFVPFRKNQGIYAMAFTPVLAALLAFVPWQMWILKFWKNAPLAQQDFPLSWHTAGLILHEGTGAGYVGAAWCIVLSAYGVANRAVSRREQALAGLTLAVSILCAVGADKVFHYYFAIRQVIFALPALALLCAMGIENLATRSVKLAAIAVVVLGAVFLVAQINWFGRSHEDWEATARKLDELTRDTQTCVVMFPPILEEDYIFFAPRLRQHQCKADFSATDNVAVVAESSYPPKKAHEEVVRAGFVPSEQFELPGHSIAVFRRKPI